MSKKSFNNLNKCKIVYRKQSKQPRKLKVSYKKEDSESNLLFIFFVVLIILFGIFVSVMDNPEKELDLYFRKVSKFIQKF